MVTVESSPQPAWERYLSNFILVLAYGAAGVVLVGLVFFVLGLVVGCGGMLAQARRDRALLDMRNIQAALKVDQVRRGHYPSTADGLRGLIRRQMLDSVPRDPWGNEYGYLLWGGCPVIWSYGADGTPGGEGRDADLCNMGIAPPEWIIERAAQAPPLPPPRSCPGSLEAHS